MELHVGPKLQRTLQRFQAKIAAGDVYEAHQTLRTIANRNVRSKAYDEATDLLYHGAQLLLQSAQPATGSDLVSYLLEVLTESGTRVDTASRGKLITLISMFDPAEPTLKQVGIECINWSVKFGDNPYGDADLHNALGQKFVEWPQLAYEAERQLVLGNSHSCDTYINHLWSWYQEDEPSNFGLYLSRAVLNYLFIENVKCARQSLEGLLSKFTATESSQFETITESSLSIQLFESQPLVNFVQLLMNTVNTGNTQLYKNLVARYQNVLQQAELMDACAYIGELYFNVPVPKQVNMLQNLMSGLLGGK